MDWQIVDPKWADPGRTGIAKIDKFFIVFTIVSSTVNHANLLVLDTDLEDPYPVGSIQTFSWEAKLWQLVEEI